MIVIPVTDFENLVACYGEQQQDLMTHDDFSAEKTVSAILILDLKPLPHL
jgi:hypothetical protein